MKGLIHFLRDERGLTMIEFAVVGGVLAIAAVFLLTDMSTVAGAKFGAAITNFPVSQ